MFLKIYLVVLHLTLLISFISADTSDFDLNHQFNHDLKDSNSDLRWWEYFISSASDTKEHKNVVPLKVAESVAFDVVQTHLTDDEIPDEEETPKFVTPTKSTKSIGAVKRPAAPQPTTTQRSLITTQPAPVKRPVAQPVKRPTTSQPTRTQPAVKTVIKSIQTTTASSSLSEDDEEELDNNTIIIKPSPKKVPAVKQPTKTRPSQPQPGTKTKQVTKVAPRPVVSQPTLKTTPRPVTTTISNRIEDNDDDDEEISVTTRRPVAPAPQQPRKVPVQPVKKPTGTKTGGVKTRPTPTVKPAIVTRPAMTTRPIVITTTSRPIVNGVKRPVESGTKSKQLPPTKIGTKQPTKTPVGTKTRPQPAPRPQPQPQPAPRTTTARPVTTTRPITTTIRPIVTTEIDDDSEDEPLPTTRPAPQQPRKVPVAQPTKRPVPAGAGVKTPARPQVTTKKVQIQTTTSRPTTVEDTDDETENNTVNKSPIPSLPRRAPSPAPVSTKSPRPAPTSVKGGTKTVIKPRPVITSTDSSSVTEDDDEETPSTSVRPVSPMKRIQTQRPQVQVTKTRPLQPQPGTKTKQVIAPKVAPRPVVSQPTLKTTPRPTTTTEILDEEEKTSAPVTTPQSRRPAPAPASTTTRRPMINGVKRPILQPQPGTKTRVTPRVETKRPVPTTTTKSLIEETEEDDEETPTTRATVRPAPRPTTTLAPRTQRPQIQTTTRRTIIVTTDESTDDEEENEIAVPRKPVPAPVPRRPIGTKTPSRPAPGTKTRPQPTVRPAIVTSVRTIEKDDDTEDETSAPTRPAPRATTPRPQTITTRRTVTVEESDDEEESEIAVPRKPVPAPVPRRPIGTKTPSRPAPGTKTRPQPTVRPAIVTTVRTIEKDDDTEDETSAPTRPAPRATTPRPQTTTTRRTVTVEESDDEEENEIAVPRKPAPAPVPRRPIGTKIPSRPAPGTKTRPQQPTVISPAKGRQTPVSRVTTARPVIITTTARAIVTTEAEEDSDDDEPLPSKPNISSPRPQRPQIQTTTRKSTIATTEEAEDEETPNEISVPRKPVPAPVPRRVTPTASTSSSIDEEDEEENTVKPTTTRRPVPSPLPRAKVQGTKIGTKTGTKTISTQSPIRTRVVSTTITTSAPIVEEDDETEPDDAPSTSRPAVPQPRVTSRPRGVKAPINTSTKTRVTPAPRIVTTTAAISEESDDEETVPAIKQPVRPAITGRKVVTRVTTRPADVETSTPIIVTSTPARRVISKTRIESMPVPRPVSFSRKSSKTSLPKEPAAPAETTLAPIPVPSFESTRRPTNPIIQSISVDNEEETNESDSLTLRRAAVRNALSTSDLAKFSSRVKYAERSTNRELRSQFRSSYSPPLIEPNDESFIEINRIK